MGIKVTIFEMQLKTRGAHRTHTSCGTSTGYSAATMNMTSLPMHIEQTLCLCMAISKVWERPLTVYIQQRAYIGPNVMNSYEKAVKLSAFDFSQVHIEQFFLLFAIV